MNQKGLAWFGGLIVVVACGSADRGGEAMSAPRADGSSSVVQDSGSVAPPPNTPSDTPPGTPASPMGSPCALGDQRICYDGNPLEAGVGICRLGSQDCVPSGEFAAWGPCVGQQLAESEACDDAADNDCDGRVDEGCEACMSGEQQSCYEGPPGTAGVGTCREGASVCEEGVFSDCADAVTPAAEQCDNGLDDDCDGGVDEDCAVPR